MTNVIQLLLLCCLGVCAGVHAGCDANCARCDGGSTCDQCKVGYYSYNETTCTPCRSRCTDCTSWGKCKGCKDGYFGDGCAYICHYSCIGGECNSTGCTRGCQPHKMGEQCTYLCSHCIAEECNVTGCLRGCIYPYFGKMCSFICSRNYYHDNEGSCQPCPSRCNECMNYHQCNDCKPGFYGYRCQYSCQDHCIGGECNITGCLRGCKDSFYPSKEDGYCHQCPQRCTSCSSDGQCIACKPGFYGNQCQQSCQDHCIGGECNMTGCTRGCNEGFYRNHEDQHCHQTCPDTCITCANMSHCTSCKLGYYGIKCDLCSSGYYKHASTCSSCDNCKDQRCDTDGTCTDGCKFTGIWGPRCDLNCSDGCLDSLCFQDDGVCYRCQPDKYGAQCDKACSAACVHPGNSSNVCRQTGGVCVFGCYPEKEGPECSGEDIVARDTTSSSRDNRSTLVWIGVGVGVGVAALVAGIAVTIACVKRRQQPAGAGQKANVALHNIARPGGNTTGNPIVVSSQGNLEQQQERGPGTSDNPYMDLDPASVSIDERGQGISYNPYLELASDSIDENEYSSADIRPAPGTSDSLYLYLDPALGRDNHQYAQPGTGTSTSPYTSLVPAQSRYNHQYAQAGPVGHQ